MLVWNPLDTRVSRETIIGYEVGADDAFCWIDHYGTYWHHCAEIPVETYISNNLTEDKIIEKFKTLRTELKRWLKNNDSRNLLVNNLQYSIKTALNLTDVNKHLSEIVDFSKIATITNMKKTRRMTHRELAHWLSKGNGEWTNAGNRTAYQRFDYDVEREDETISEHIKIRGWNETEWREPLIEE